MIFKAAQETKQPFFVQFKKIKKIAIHFFYKTPLTKPFINY